MGGASWFSGGGFRKGPRHAGGCWGGLGGFGGRGGRWVGWVWLGGARRPERRGGRGIGWTPAADRRDGVSRAKAAGLIEWPCGCSRRTTHEERRRWSPAARGVATRVQRRPSVR